MNKIKILVVEDDKNIREGLIDLLELASYSVTAVGDGSSALAQFNQFKPDLILLDIMLPNLNGYDVCKQIRRTDPQVPIIMLSAKSEEIDKVLGLELGADDYITKPFGVRELLARVASKLRNQHLCSNKTESQSNLFEFGYWQINTECLTGNCNEHEIKLTVREVELLKYFAKYPNVVLDRNRLMRAAWEINFNSSRTLDQHMVGLRRKLNIKGAPKLIETIYGVGYRYKVD